MRLVAAVCVFIIGAAWGILKSSELRRRVQLIAELKQLITEFSVAIRCTAPTLDELADGCGGIFGELLRNARHETDDIRSAWQTAAQQLSDCSFCGKEETAILTELGRELGTCSAEGQLELLELHQSRLDKLLTEAEVSAKSKGKMFHSVGALLGAGAAVLII